MSTYKVICPDADGRGSRVETEHASLSDALRCLYEWYLVGPNGPYRMATLHRASGEHVSAATAAAEEGMVLLGSPPQGQSAGWYPGDCEAIEAAP